MQQILKPLPSFIECLIIPLCEVGDLIPQTCRFARWEELDEEGPSKRIPHGDTSQRQRMQPSSCLIPSEKENNSGRMASVETSLSFAHL